MTFNEYLASEITPQDTLIQKFNKLIKWLKEEAFTKLYKHTLTSVGGTKLIFISNTKDLVEGTGTFFMANIANKVLGQLECNYMGSIYPCVLSYTGTNTLGVKFTNFVEFLSSTFDTENYEEVVEELL